MASDLYKMNTDYQALINKEKAKGASASQADIDKWTTARQAKIADNPNMYDKWGINTATEATKNYQATPTFRQYVEGGGLTGDKNYQLSNIGSTPTINGVAIDPKAYGLKLVNGHWVGTQDQYEQLLSPLNNLVSPQQQQSLVQDNRESPYTAQLNNQMVKLLEYQPFQYDPTQDSALQQAQQQASKTAVEAVTKAAARKNMLYGSGTTDKAAEAAAEAAINLVPTYRQQALDQYNTNLQSEQQKLSNLQLLDEMNYGRGQDTFANKVVEAGLTGNWGDIRTLEGSQIDMNKEQQSWEQMYTNKTFDYQKTRDVVSDMQFGQQYQLELDNFLWNKSKNNPAVQRQILENKVLDIEIDYLPQEKRATLAKIWQDVDSGKVSMDVAKKNIEALQAEIAQTKATTAQTKANTLNIKAQTEALKNQSTATSEATSTLSYKDAKSTFLQKVTGGKGVDSKNKTQQKNATNEFLRLYKAGVSPSILYQISTKYDFTLPDDIY